MGTNLLTKKDKDKFYWSPNLGATKQLKTNHKILFMLMTRHENLIELSKNKKLIKQICMRLSCIEECGIEWENRIYKIPKKLKNLKREFEKLVSFTNKTMLSLQNDLNILELTKLDYRNLFSSLQATKYIEALIHSNEVCINKLSGNMKKKRTNRYAEYIWFCLLVDVIFAVQPKANRKTFLNSLAEVLNKYNSRMNAEYIKKYEGRGLEGIIERGLATHFKPRSPFYDDNKIFNKKVSVVSDWRLKARPLKKHKNYPYF